jgi:endonuclease G
MPDGPDAERPQSGNDVTTTTIPASSAFVLPMTVTVRIGTPVLTAPAGTTGSTGSGPGASAVLSLSPAEFVEKISIDPEYSNRPGYDPAFLGQGDLRVSLPRLSPDLLAEAIRLTSPAQRGAPYELTYHHFSVVMHRSRRLAIFTAVNIDGASALKLSREADRWFSDPRVAKASQVVDAFYKAAHFDRGHLVRRLDPSWGSAEQNARVANDDTFHFTNCSPQHPKFNRGKNLWTGLEDFLLDRAADDRKMLTIFTGPVFSNDDPVFEGLMVPKQYWKVAVIVRPNGKLAALAFVVSQEELLNPNAQEATVDVAIAAQVQVARIEALTGLDFGALRDLEPPTVGGFGLESAAIRPLESLEDIALSWSSDALPAPRTP